MRFLGTLFTTLLIAAGAVQAQIAAPMLAPMAATTVGGFFETALIPLSSNPAAMQWSDYSFVGISRSDGEQTGQIGGAPESGFDGDLEATFFQVRVVWEFFSIGVEVSDSEKKLVNPSPFPAVEDVSQTNLALAFRIGDSVALGLGREANESLVSDFTLNLAGLSLRLGEVFFIGAALGTETFSDPTTPSTDRDVSRFGVGLRTGRDTVQWHLEVFLDSGDAFNAELVPGAFFSFVEYEATGLVAEMNWGGFLLGIRSINRDLTTRDAAGAVVQNGDWETEETTITVGWVPESGFSIIGAISSAESTGSVTTRVRELDTVSLGVGYVF